MGVKKLWITEGCIYCNLCESIAPDVFVLENDETSEVKEGAEKHYESLEEDIKEAAEACPVEVIKWEDSEGQSNDE